jgi:hypothetical protein
MLQGFPDGAIRIGPALGVVKEAGQVTYFVGPDNYFSHAETDAAGQRFIIASLIANRHVRACEVEASCLGIAPRTLMRWTRQLAEEGPGSFYLPQRVRGAAVVTELLASVPSQPTQAQLDADPLLPRFVVIFDREGANHSLFSKLWERRIGAISYRKDVKDRWPESEFAESEVPIPGGGSTRMKLAFRQTELSAKDASMPVLEVRCLTETSHQTVIITTARGLANPLVAGRMFSRWCQENFFKYMMEHYDIDGLVQYGCEEIPGTVVVVNPAWRALDKTAKDTLRKIRKLHAKLGATTLHNDGGDIQSRAQLHQDIASLEADMVGLRVRRRGTPRKVPIASLPEDERPRQLLPLGKMLTDTVKMIAYRAETALVALLRLHLAKEDEARAMIRELFVSSADLEPDEQANTLTVRIHRMACPAHDKAVAALLDDLTKLAFLHPETHARLIYHLA